MASIILASGAGHSEYLNYIAEPTWTAVIVEGGNKIRVRAMGSSAPVEKRAFERIKLNKTVNAVCHFRDVMGMMFDGYERLIGMLQERFTIEGSEGRFTPKEPDE